MFYKVICVFFEQGNKLNIKQLINQRIFILLFYFLITFFFGVGISSGQELTLKGRVVNKSKQPIEFIHATLLKNDSTYVEGTATDSLGYFSFKAQKGNYKLILEQFGAEYFNDTLDLNEDLDLGEIEIDESVTLEDIIITAGKRLIEQKVDRLVFNVEGAINASGSNGLDVLKLAPRIKVQNDKIFMIGKSNISVLINDRIIQMSEEDLTTYLKSLNAEDIKSIEVIANPPAKYSAEGNSGLVNIVLKKVENDAWNASIRGFYQQASYAKGSTGGSFNIQKGKFQLSTALSYTNGSNAPQETNKIYYPNLTWNEINNRRDFTDAISARLGLEYKINSKLSTGFVYNFINSTPLIKEIDKTTLSSSINNVIDSLITTLGRNEYKRKLNSFNYHIVYNLDTIGRRLSLDADIFDYKNQTNRFFNTQSFFSNNQPIPNSFKEIRNYGVQDIQNYSINIDMEHPTNWANLNYGGRISFTKSNNLFNYSDIINNKEIPNPNFSNQFNYKENTQALYLSALKSFSEKWEAKVGLRYEFTQTEGFSQTLSQINTNDYSKLFSTAYIAYSPNDYHFFSLNYGRRISRPNFGDLNPFRFVNNPYSYSEGNPFLQPAFTDNIEFEYSYKDNLITNIYYSYTDDDFEQVTIIDTNSNVQQVIPLNFIINKMFGVSQIFIFKPIKWWKINSSADVYYSDTNSKIPVTLQYLSGWNGVFQISNDFTLNSNKTILFNLSYAYVTKGVSNLDSNSSTNQLDVSFKWLLLNNKLIISLYGNDLLSSNRITYTSFSNGIKNSFRNYYDERFFRIGVIYNFGKKFNVNIRENKNQVEQNRTY